MPEENEYSLKAKASKKRIAAPDLPYLPHDPENYRPAIGLIACGGITESHLTAYSKAGYRVTALCDLIIERVEKRRKQFYPEAFVTTDYRELLDRADIEVVDIATHPQDRPPLIEAALKAGKHVLSQKPFALNLDTGERLVRLADQEGKKLAVNQNGRWAPHFSYLREAVKHGLLGDLRSLHFDVHWDHSWTQNTPFERIRDLILYDFGIHWFDLTSCLLGERKPDTVFATRSRAAGQTMAPSLLAEAMISFPGGQASLVFDGFLKHGSLDRTYAGGSAGTFVSEGADLGSQKAVLYTQKGSARVTLEGKWFTDGFHGTMGELLCAIEEDREPVNSARENLNSLALCFAAIASADEGVPKRPGDVRSLPAGAAPGAG